MPSVSSSKPVQPANAQRVPCYSLGLFGRRDDRLVLPPALSLVVIMMFSYAC